MYIFYFTSTGNSLAVSRTVAEKCGAALVGIPYALQTKSVSIQEGDTIGIVFPLYAYGLPKIVQKFISETNLSKAGYLFSIVTEGGNTGYPKDQMVKLCKAAGHALDACWWLQMPNNYTLIEDTQSKKVQEKIRAAAEKKLAKIITSVSRKEKVCEGTKFFTRRYAESANRGFSQNIGLFDRKFTVLPSCTNCSICIKICPVNNISDVDGKKIWNQNCEGCLACMHFCPEKAIVCGERRADNAQYHYPDVTAEDIIAQKYP
ncbi:MAG TPA: EFR1 family ferrodoxin [Methanocorpusculum sp.]|nr:EFR1 family ferrodoxin [Methanocorpusculum sp.]